ncbi:hypothetical protein ACQJBY_065335 [Aegilops geniculata]
MGPGVTATAVLGATGLAHRQSSLAGARSNQRVVEKPREAELVTASELVTLVHSDRGTEDREIPDKVVMERRQTTLPSGVDQIRPIESRQVSLPPVVEHLQPMEKSRTVGIVANEDVRALSSPVVERVLQIGLQGTASPQTGYDRDQAAQVELDPMRTDPSVSVGEDARVGQPAQPLIPRVVGPGQERCLAEGWAPVEELLEPNDCDRSVASVALDTALVEPAVGPVGDVTTSSALVVHAEGRVGDMTTLHETDAPARPAVDVHSTRLDQSIGG